MKILDFTASEGTDIELLIAHISSISAGMFSVIFEPTPKHISIL